MTEAVSTGPAKEKDDPARKEKERTDANNYLAVSDVGYRPWTYQTLCACVCMCACVRLEPNGVLHAAGRQASSQVPTCSAQFVPLVLKSM